MSDFSFGGGGSIGSFGSCDGCDAGDCDCDCDGCDCDCDCGDCSCPDCDCDCDCDCCKNCCDEVCFRCCATVYNCTVNGCTDYVCCCFFQTTTATDGRQRSDSSDSHHEYEMYNRSTHVPVVVTSPPEVTSRAVNGAKGPKLRKGGQKDHKDDDELTPEELEQRVMAGDEDWQPENEQLQQPPDGDLDPTAPPIETEIEAMKRPDAFVVAHSGATGAGEAAAGMDDPSANPDHEQSTSLLGLEKVTDAKDGEFQHTQFNGPLTSHGDESKNLPEEEVPTTGQNEEALHGYQARVEMAADTSSYPTVDPPSYDEVVVTTQPSANSDGVE